MFHTSILVALLGLLTTSVMADPMWHLDNSYILATEELDPIVSPNKQSSHMHKIIGGSSFSAAYSYGATQGSSCTSLAPQADKSNYWMPQLYWIDSANKDYIPMKAGTRFYYVFSRNSKAEDVKPFPEGLRMVAGSPDNKSPSSYLDFHCHIYPNLTNSLPLDSFNFARDCPYGLRTQVFFPACWDGLNLYKSDNSHVVYPIGTNGGTVQQGNCPLTHPYRMPGIILEYTWQPAQVSPGTALAGNLAWANGDTTGYGMHADFQMGWDLEVLTSAMNSNASTAAACAMSSDGGVIPFQNCPPLAATFNINTAQSCTPDKGVLQESFGNVDYVPIPRLPGCNPLWGASGSKPGCSPAVAGLDVSSFTGTDGAYVTDSPQNFVMPTKPGWTEIACLSGNTYFSGVYSYTDPNLTKDTCISTCAKGGYPFAAMALRTSAWTCTCATGLDQTQAPVVPGMCNTPCPGNSAQNCGGLYFYDVYYAPNGTVTPTANSTSIGATANGAPYIGCYNTYQPSPSTYTWSSNTMTAELCTDSCAQRNSSWAATFRGNGCSCGVTLNSGSTANYVPDSWCTTQCVGNSSEICGGTQSASMYDVSKLHVAAAPTGRISGYQGCYPAPSGGTALPGITFSSTSMTQAMCVNACSEQGYAYAGLRAGTGCFCGNTPANTGVLPTNQCNTACPGNSTTMCGAATNMDLYLTAGYATVASVGQGMPAPYLGCYPDNAGTLLSDYTYTANTMTIEVCVAACASMNYAYAGLENTNHCNCGNTFPTVARAASAISCTANCPANSAEKCGAYKFMSLFNATTIAKPSASSSTNGTATVGSGSSSSSTTGSSAYVGCYTNSPVGLSGYTFALTNMTIDTCRTACNELDYTLSALTGGTSCSCGNTWAGGQVLPISSCTTQCGGDSTQICGATQISSVYKSDGAQSLPSFTAGYKGCYQDSSAHLMNDWAYKSNLMSVNACKTSCQGQGYPLAGMEGGNICYCGSNTTTPQIPSVLCNSPCTGNSAVICGGTSYRMSLYDSGAAATTSSSTGTAAANSTASSVAPIGVAAPSGTALAGMCYSDDSTLNGVYYASDLMSLTICGSYCQARGFTYAGVKSSTCRCGNTSPAQAAVKTACNSPCSADPTQICGSTSAISVINAKTAKGLSPSGFVFNTNSTGFAGCLADTGSTRIMTNLEITSNGLTATQCVQNCQALGFAYAGARDGIRCYCADTPDVNSGGFQVANADCNTPCKGGGDYSCGGASTRVSVYEVAKYPNNSIALNEGEKGCFAPGTLETDSTLFSYTTNSMTPTLCRQTCRLRGNSVAAVWYGTHCTCSDGALYGAQLPPAQCGTKCYGDSTVFCGGTPNTAVNIYDTTGAGAFAPATTFGSTYVGCYLDFTARVLNNYTFNSPGMTNDLCQRTCSSKGFSVSGTESSNTCYCGTDLPNSGLAPITSCSASCSGVASQKCGGTYVLSVYQAKAAVVSSSSSAAKSSTTASITKPVTSSVSKSSAAASSVTKASSAAASSVTTKASSAAGSSVTKASSAAASSVTKASSAAASSVTKASSAAVSSVTKASSAAASSITKPVTSSVTKASSSSVSSASKASSTSVKPVVSSTTVVSSKSSAKSSITGAQTGDLIVTHSTTVTVASSTAKSVAASSVTKASSTTAKSVAASSVTKAASSTTTKASTTTAKASTTTTKASTTVTSSTAAAAATSPYSLGCYAPSATATPVFTSSSIKICENFTPQTCSTWCKANGFTYFGLTGGNVCGCAANLNNLSKASTGSCATACNGEANAMCGGTSGSFFNVYSNTAPAAKREVDGEANIPVFTGRPRGHRQAAISRKHRV